MGWSEAAMSFFESIGLGMERFEGFNLWNRLDVASLDHPGQRDCQREILTPLCHLMTYTNSIYDIVANWLRISGRALERPCAPNENGAGASAIFDRPAPAPSHFQDVAALT